MLSDPIVALATPPGRSAVALLRLSGRGAFSIAARCLSPWRPDPPRTVFRARLSAPMQTEIAEVSEPGGNGRGGSSTMPHKRNPIACTLTLAAASRVPHMVASFLSAMPQQHERGAGGWQAEWPSVASVIQSTGLAAASMAEVAAGLWVDEKRMRSNLESTNGLVFAERAMMVLAPKLGRDAAHKLIDAAAKRCIAEGTHLADIMAEMPEVTAYLPERSLRNLESPEEYLGAAEEFRRAQVARVAKHSVTTHSARARKRKER